MNAKKPGKTALVFIPSHEQEEAIRDLREENPEALTADGLDSAFLGVCRRVGQPSIAVYDSDRCIRIFMAHDGMSREDAYEFFAFNTAGAWVGEHTPIFLWTIKPSSKKERAGMKARAKTRFKAKAKR